MNDLAVIILAAGRGTRMKSNLPKVMHKVAGRSMINHVIAGVTNLSPDEISVVVSEEFEEYKDLILSSNPDQKINFVTQYERLGTADATKIGYGALTKEAKKVLVLYGDTPLIRPATMADMIDKTDHEHPVCVLGFECHQANQYGKFLISKDGKLEKIIEHKDANEAEKRLKLCNSGVVAINGNDFNKLLNAVDDNNAAGEYYLTDIVKISRQNDKFCNFICTNEEEVLGVNSRKELSMVESILQDQLREKHMSNGVTMLDPDSVYFSADTKIGNDTIIHQNVIFVGAVELASNVEIKSFSHIEEAEIAENAVIGPFARIRPGSEIGEKVRVGNFVEIKKSKLQKGSKVNHLAYIGDAEVGKGSNIGAGVITCNYDGFNKYQTEIGDEVFVGTNSSLVAPVKIGDGAMVAAGSVVTSSVAEDELAVSRSKQRNIVAGAAKFRANKKS